MTGPTVFSQDDFIQVVPDALSRELCAEIVARIRASDALRPGQVGGGVYPELKHSRDISITGQAGWQDVEQVLNLAMLDALVHYLRAWPQALIAPLMLQRQTPDGSLRRLAAEDFPDMDAAQLSELARHCLRPGSVNLQWHCELYPRDPGCETLHRHLLWTVYLNEEFEEGETEFLFQRRRIKPTTGTLLIAPAGFTHTHRGNRPQGGDKFIATSWILFQKAERLFAQG
jgi:hypothetical protein